MDTYIPVNVIGQGIGYCKGGEICELLPKAIEPIVQSSIVQSSHASLMLAGGFIMFFVTIIVIKRGRGDKRKLVYA